MKESIDKYFRIVGVLTEEHYVKLENRFVDGSKFAKVGCQENTAMYGEKIPKDIRKKYKKK